MIKPSYGERKVQTIQKHDRQAAICHVLDLALSSTRLGICHTVGQVRAWAKQIERDTTQRLNNRNKRGLSDAKEKLNVD